MAKLLKANELHSNMMKNKRLAKEEESQSDQSELSDSSHSESQSEELDDNKSQESFSSGEEERLRQNYIEQIKRIENARTTGAAQQKKSQVNPSSQKPQQEVLLQQDAAASSKRQQEHLQLKMQQQEASAKLKRQEAGPKHQHHEQQSSSETESEESEEESDRSDAEAKSEEVNSLPKISEDEEEETPETRKFIKKVNKHPGIQLKREGVPEHDLRESHEILGVKSMNKLGMMKRPQTAKPAVVERQSLSFNNSAVRKSSSNLAYSAVQREQAGARPMTASIGKENSFKPVYNMGMQEFMVRSKCYNFKEKTFKTIPKKSDPVSRYQSMRNEWSKTKFLTSKSGDGKQGRKLNLCDRINASKPEQIFYRYLPKHAYF